MDKLRALASGDISYVKVPVRMGTFVEIAVKLNGKLTGYIRAEQNGWRYHAGGHAGELFPTLWDCKMSLEA